MSEDSNIILSIENLSKSFSDKGGNLLAVIDGLTLSLSQGKITTILGASGCGKTTLLKMLAGLELPDGGSVHSNITRPGRAIGYLQQSERLLPWRTVLENVALGLELIGEDKKQAQIKSRALLDEVGMLDFSSVYPSQLSGGMTQRVLLARTLITEPSLLLLDEPLGQLDLVARKELARTIRNYVHEHAAAALLVTHSVEEAVFISDVVFTLSRRPSKIVERFNLVSGADAKADGSLDRQSSFDFILQALLRALGASGGSAGVL